MRSFSTLFVSRPALAVSLVLMAVLADASQAAQPRAREHVAGERESALREAQAALARGDATAAEAGFRALLLDEPDLAVALLGRSAALRALGRSAEAVSPLLRAAERLLRRGAELEAIALLEAAAAEWPDRAALVALLGEARLRARRFLAAEAALERAAVLGPATPRLLHALAAAQWENGKLEAAELSYRGLLEAAPGDAEAWFQLGRLLAWKGRYAEALACFDRVGALEPERFDLLVERARALDGASRERLAGISHDVVVQAHAAAVTALPEDYQARYGLARALRRAGEEEAAAREMAAFERLYAEHQARTRLSGLDQARLDLASERLRAGAPEEALRALEDVTPSAESHRARALAHVALDDDASARRELEQAVALDPGRADLRALLSQLRSSRDEP